jgi:hypothetical protein
MPSASAFNVTESLISRGTNLSDEMNLEQVGLRAHMVKYFQGFFNL